MPRHIVVPAVAVVVVLMATPLTLQADPFLYAFSGFDLFTLEPESFSFYEPGLITTNGPFSFTPFTISGTTFTFGIFELAPSAPACFEFADVAGMAGITECREMLNPNEFWSDFPGATNVGTYLASIGGGTCNPPQQPCVVLTSLTITQTSEPSSLTLLGSGLAGLGTIVRRKLRK